MRGNHLPFMNKTLSKEIMKRTKLRNKFLKERTNESKQWYTSKRNYCVSLLKRQKKNYYDSLNEKDVSDNKTSWRTVKPFLCHAIGHHVLPTQPLPRKAEDFPRGDTHFKHVPPLKYLICLSPKELYMVGLFKPCSCSNLWRICSSWDLNSFHDSLVC